MQPECLGLFSLLHSCLNLEQSYFSWQRLDQNIHGKPSFRPILQYGIFSELDFLLHQDYAALSNKRETLESLQFVFLLPSHKLMLYFSTSIMVSPLPSFLRSSDLPVLNADGLHHYKPWEGKLASWLAWVHTCKCLYPI